MGKTLEIQTLRRRAALNGLAAGLAYPSGEVSHYGWPRGNTYQRFGFNTIRRGAARLHPAQTLWHVTVRRHRDVEKPSLVAIG